MPSLTFHHTWLREQRTQTKRKRQNLEIRTQTLNFFPTTPGKLTPIIGITKAGVTWESASRINFPNAFQQILFRLSHKTLVQSAQAHTYWASLQRLSKSCADFSSLVLHTKTWLGNISEANDNSLPAFFCFEKWDKWIILLTLWVLSLIR